MEYTGPKINGVSTGSIAKRSGIPVNTISKLCGIDATLIGLPGHFTGPKCKAVLFGYSEGRSTSPESACSAPQTLYEFDGDNGILYVSGMCGEQFAKPGYYSDGDVIYFWDPRTGLSEYGSCGPVQFNGPWFNTVYAPSYTDTYAVPTRTYVGFYGVQDGTPRNSVYANIRFTINSNIVDGDRNLAGEIYKWNVLEEVNGAWIQSTDWRNGSPNGYGDYSLDKGGNRNTAFGFRMEYDPVNGFVRIPWEYQFSYANADANNEFYFRDRTPFVNRFNLRIFKILLYPIWQDDTSYYEIVINAGDEEHSPYVISQASYYQGVQNF